MSEDKIMPILKRIQGLLNLIGEAEDNHHNITTLYAIKGLTQTAIELYEDEEKERK